MQTMISFTCDYSEGAHPMILARLAETNLEQLPGYGMDHYCESAKAKIREACEAPDADVFFQYDPYSPIRSAVITEYGL